MSQSLSIPPHTMLWVAASASDSGDVPPRAARDFTKRPFVLDYPDHSGSTPSTLKVPPVATVSLFFTQKQDLGPEQVFARLKPFERVRFLAKNDLFSLVSSVLAVIVSIYVLIRSTAPLVLSAVHAFSSAALAAERLTQDSQLSSRDPYDWFLSGLMAVVLLISVAGTYLATNTKKIEFGKDTTKTILGFVLGFLGAGRLK